MARSVLDDLGEEITGIVAPVSICMALVVVLVKALNPDGMADSSSVAIATIAYHEQVSSPRFAWQASVQTAYCWFGSVVLSEQSCQLKILSATASGCTQQHTAHMVQRSSRHQAVRAVKAHICACLLPVAQQHRLFHSNKQSYGRSVSRSLTLCYLWWRPVAPL